MVNGDSKKSGIVTFGDSKLGGGGGYFFFVLKEFMRANDLWLEWRQRTGACGMSSPNASGISPN